MRTLIVTEFISLDGVVDSPGGGEHPRAGWTFKDIQLVEEAYEIKGREQVEAGAMLIGRVSYDEFAPVWPKMDEFAEYNAMPKYVVSTTLSDPSGTTPRCCARSTRSRAQGGRRRQHHRPRQRHAREGPRRGRPGRPLPPARLPGRARRRQAPVQRRATRTSLELVEHEAYSNGVVKPVFDVER